MKLRSNFCGGAVVALLALSLSACGNAYPEIKTAAPKARSKEYFAEKEYGVKASPRMVSSDYDTTTKQVALVPIPRPIGSTDVGQAYALAAPAKSLRRGGGRLSIGKPYMVRGKWYKPADQPGYSREGKASWYGDAFHGRLTANGEIYDMNNLTAAHPTLPLPSYARVTNVANGTSVIVRINDRGPFAEGRVIDLSKRVAQVLDTKHAGIGRVKVDYIGVAPVDGNDDHYLLASFRQNGAGNNFEDMTMYAALTGGVAPTQPVMTASAEVLQPAQAFAPLAGEAVLSTNEYASLENLPAPISRPLEGVPLRYSPALTVKADRFGTVLKGDGYLKGVEPNWKNQLAKKSNHLPPVEIFVGNFAKQDLVMIEQKFAKIGRLSFAEHKDGIRVSILATNKSADSALKKLWAVGYKDAFALR